MAGAAIPVDILNPGAKLPPDMKKLLLSVACVGLVSLPAFAGTCPAGGGCGGGGEKPKEGEKSKDGAKQTLTIRVQE